MVLEKERKKKTRIVCTIGPASEDKKVLTKLVQAGMNVMRLNFSHGDFEEHGGRIKTLREINKELNKNVAILLDTKGPEIRTGDFVGGKTEFKKGQVSTICVEDIEGTSERFTITYKDLYKDVKPGGFILVNDGQVELLVDHVDGTDIVCICANDGVVKNKRGINVPGIKLGFDYLSEKDIGDLTFGCQQGVDFIAASFVRKPQDVLDIRELLEEKHMEHVQIFPKIESQEGIDNIDDILKVSDGLMIARGDMGVEIPAENVPLVQKALIKKCNALGMPVITATQMLDSMQENPRPTRAEASDVANAVFDGTDATMLSGESANGDYPVEAVATMARIDVKAENALRQHKTFALNDFDKTDVTEAIGRAVAEAADNLNIKTIVAATKSGHTARMISKYRPDADILAVTFDERTRRGLSINWGVYPVVAETPSSTDEMFSLATEEAKKCGFAKEGDLILITAGVPVGEKGTTNVMKIQLIGSKLVEGQGVGDETVIGKTVVASSADEANKKAIEGGILVTSTTDKDYLPAIEKSSALIVENGGLTSHAAVVGISMGIPVIVGAKNATSLISDGEVVTVDSRRGIVYHGASNAL